LSRGRLRREIAAFSQRTESFAASRLGQDHRHAKDVGLRILNMNFDTASPTGKMMLTMLGSIAQFEREIMLERQKEGIAKASSRSCPSSRSSAARIEP
jgi:DNA invertase Pin-like site-specific DNA recombinase